MKAFIYVLMILTAILVVYNCTQINFQDPLGDASIMAVIIVVIGLCSILLLAILRTSKRIEDTVKKKKRNV